MSSVPQVGFPPEKICLSGQHAGQVLKQVMEHGCTFLPQNMLPVPSAFFATHPSQTAYIQWPFQEPKLEVPTIWPMVQGYVREYPHKIWPYVVQYLHFRILEFPLIY